MFRFKIALLSLLLSGSVLVGLGLYSLSVISRVSLDRIDREILSLGEGHLAIGPPREYWQNFEQSLQFIYRRGGAEHLVVQVLDPGNEVLFRSPQWPAEITLEAFPDFDRQMEGRWPAAAVQAVGKGRGGSGADPVPAQDGKAPRDDRRGPPPEAYLVCQGKRPGAAAQFTDPRGEVVSGICEAEAGRMVLKGTRPRGDKPAPQVEGTADRPAAASLDSGPPDKPVPRIKRPSLATFETSSGAWRVGVMGSERITLLVGIDLANFYADAGRYRRAFLGTVPVALLLLAAGGWLIARRALQPVVLIRRTAEAITARALDQRIPQVAADSELSLLVTVINRMLGRLEQSFGQAVRFSADAAHELQTPLTILQGELEEALVHAPADSSEQQRYAGLLEEVQRLKAVVQKLLMLARADAGRLELRLDPTDLSALIEAAAEDAGLLAPQLTIHREIPPGIVVLADRGLLRQAIGNLTSNAVKFNRAGGRIEFHLSVQGRQSRVTIANTGTAIPGEERERIFERFYRADRSRGKKVPGSGLGLSLAREIVRAHDGDLRLDPGPEGMVSFSLSLPLAPP